METALIDIRYKGDAFYIKESIAHFALNRLHFIG